jgi:glucosamine kinase
MAQIVVGVDGGGSKTQVIVSTPRGKVLADVTGDASAVRPGEALSSAEVIGALVRDALAQAEITDRPGVLVAGVAGTGREKEQKALLRALRGESLADEVKVVPDAEIALTDAFGIEGVGILLIAGGNDPKSPV